MPFQTNYSETVYENIFNPTTHIMEVSKSPKTILKDELHAACFASVFSALNNGRFVECIVYIKEFYSLYNLTLTELELINWLDILANIGIKFEYLGEIEGVILPNLEKHHRIWGVKITLKNNTIQTIKLFLNLVRYMYEDMYSKIPKEVIRLKKLIPEADNIELIHLANYVIGCPVSGHNCFYYTKGLLVNQKQINSKFINCKSVNNETNELNKTEQFTIPSLKTDEEITSAYKQLKQKEKELV